MQIYIISIFQIQSYQKHIFYKAAAFLLSLDIHSTLVYVGEQDVVLSFRQSLNFKRRARAIRNENSQLRRTVIESHLFHVGSHIHSFYHLKKKKRKKNKD